MYRQHSDPPRGEDNVPPPSRTSYEGRFGRLFSDLPAAHDPVDDLDALRAINPNLPWRAIAVLLAVALAMAALAWSLIRRCFRRFDEWVGRPHRTSATFNEPVFRSTAADSAGILCR